MTSKERLMLAINKQKPDRLPVTVHQWQAYHIDTYMKGISALEAFKQCGMDAQIQYFEDMAQFWLVDADFTKCNTRQWKDIPEIISSNPDSRVVHHKIETPGGALSYKTCGDRKTTWITEYLIKKDEDILLIDKFMPVPQLKLKPVQTAYDKIGDDGILRGFVWGDQAGCWQHAACLYDINELLIRAMLEPEWVHELLKILLRPKLQFIESMKGAKFDLIETGGGASSSTLVSPDMHKEFCLPYDKIIHQALHDLGFKITYHTCGGTLGIEAMIIEHDTDCSATLAPVRIESKQEPWDFKRKVGKRIALIGGIDQHNVLTEMSDAEITKQVDVLFEKVGYDGGYILSCADHFFDTPVDKLKVYAKAARNCMY